MRIRARDADLNPEGHGTAMVNLLNVGARFLPMKPLAGRIQTDPRPQLRHEADPTMVETHGVQTPPSWLFHRACATPQRVGHRTSGPATAQLSQCPTSKGCRSLVQRPWPNRQPPAATSTVSIDGNRGDRWPLPFKEGTISGRASWTGGEQGSPGTPDRCHPGVVVYGLHAGRHRRAPRHLGHEGCGPGEAVGLATPP
jgi:hypothetical protein